MTPSENWLGALILARPTAAIATLPNITGGPRPPQSAANGKSPSGASPVSTPRLGTGSRAASLENSYPFVRLPLRLDR